MSTPRVDYTSFAEAFDKGRSLSETKEALWLNLVKQHLGLEANSRVLDVGCGTGRFSVSVARHFQCAVTGIDPSPSMLARAKTKCPDGIGWLLARGEAIPLQDNAFDVCLASYTLHHFLDKSQVFGEMYRVLQYGGRLGMRYSSHAQLRTMLDYRFFPSALSIDLERVPDILEVKDLMQTVGFNVMEEQIVHQQLFESADDYLTKLRLKYVSVLSLIPEEEYQRGLEKAAAYLEAGKLKASDKFVDTTFLVGVK